MEPSVCSFSPRPTATSFSGSGGARTLRRPAQEQEQGVEEYHVPCPGNPPAAAIPLHSQFEGNSPHQEVIDHPGGFAGSILHQAPLLRRLGAQIADEKTATQDSHPYGDPGPDMPKPGRSSKTQTGKGNIGSGIDLAPDMAGSPCLARQQTIEDIGEGNEHIQQEEAQPPQRQSFAMRVDEEHKKQGSTR